MGSQIDSNFRDKPYSLCPIHLLRSLEETRKRRQQTLEQQQADDAERARRVPMYAAQVAAAGFAGDSGRILDDDISTASIKYEPWRKKISG